MRAAASLQRGHVAAGGRTRLSNRPPPPCRRGWWFRGDLHRGTTRATLPLNAHAGLSNIEEGSLVHTRSRLPMTPGHRCLVDVAFLPLNSSAALALDRASSPSFSAGGRRTNKMISHVMSACRHADPAGMEAKLRLKDAPSCAATGAHPRPEFAPKTSPNAGRRVRFSPLRVGARSTRRQLFKKQLSRLFLGAKPGRHGHASTHRSAARGRTRVTGSKNAALLLGQTPARL